MSCCFLELRWFDLDYLTESNGFGGKSCWNFLLSSICCPFRLWSTRIKSIYSSMTLSKYFKGFTYISCFSSRQCFKSSALCYRLSQLFYSASSWEILCSSWNSRRSFLLFRSFSRNLSLFISFTSLRTKYFFNAYLVRCLLSVMALYRSIVDFFSSSSILSFTLFNSLSETLMTMSDDFLDKFGVLLFFNEPPNLGVDYSNFPPS